MLNKSERLKLIDKINNKLELEKVNKIGMLLKEFNFDNIGYGGMDFDGRESYISNKLLSGKDEDIVELAKHLGFEVVHTTYNPKPTFWITGCFKLFVSHLASNRIEAMKLKEDLYSAYGISCFVAHEDVEPSKEWQVEIELALKTCDGLLALLVPDFHKSIWTDQEIGFALGRNLAIVPIRAGLDPYGFIAKIQAITEPNHHNLLKKICIFLLKNERSHKAMKFALMSKFENAGSYRDAKDFLDLLNLSPFWNDELIERLELAAKNNNQVGPSAGVKEIIDQILKDYSKEKNIR